jgi:hypothetical protein
MKKLLIALVLLTGSANANFFEALKDAAVKAIEEQNRLNSAVDGNSPAMSDQVPTPKFNTLAEEAAYKKRQEEERKISENEKDRILQENMISSMKNVRTMRTSYYEKYFVKKTDSKEIIEAKYAKRMQLVKEMQNDRALLKSEAQKIDQMYRSNKYNLSVNYNEREFEGTFPNYLDEEQKAYILYYENNSMAEDIDDENSYSTYLKEAYNSFDTRQAAIAEAKANQIKAQKEQQAKLANEQKARQKVQSACQAWRAKANKSVYSLGVGEQVMSKKGLVGVIQEVNTNTFLVKTLWGSVYLQKSDLIPYASLKTAPSQYCYR